MPRYPFIRSTWVISWEPHFGQVPFISTAEYEKLKKASIRSPDVRLSAKQDGILTAIQLLEQAEKRKRGRASAIRRKLIDAGMFTEDGKPAAKVTMQVPDWLGDFDPEAGRLV